MDQIKDYCCICYDMNLALDKGTNSNAFRMSCCGALFCKSCNEGMDKKAAETPLKERTCPMCRTLYPKNKEETFVRYVKHAKEGRAWAMEMVGHLYKQGRGTVQSYKKAFEYSLQAADLGQAGS